MDTIMHTLKHEGQEAGQLNLSYPDKSLEELKQQHSELTILNQLLSQKLQQLPKEDSSC